MQDSTFPRVKCFCMTVSKIVIGNAYIVIMPVSAGIPEMKITINHHLTEGE